MPIDPATANAFGLLDGHCVESIDDAVTEKAVDIWIFRINLACCAIEWAGLRNGCVLDQCRDRPWGNVAVLAKNEGREAGDVG